MTTTAIDAPVNSDGAAMTFQRKNKINNGNNNNKTTNINDAAAAKNSAPAVAAGSGGAETNQLPVLNAQEIAYNRYVSFTDFFGMIPMTLGYYFFGKLAGDHWQAPSDSWWTAPARDTMPEWLKVGSYVTAAAALYALYLHMFCMAPVYQSCESKYKVMSKVGRWCFLTRWCIALQAIHHTCCAVIAYDPSLFPLFGIVPGAAPLAGGVGLFVTCQFFSLVVPSPRFKEEIETLTRQGYPQIWIYQMITHTACTFCALFDAIYFQPAVVQWVPITQFIVVVLIWVVSYVSCIFVNFYLTGEWPYFVLEKNGKNPIKWGMFITFQTCIMLAFDVCLRVCRMYTPRVW